MFEQVNLEEIEELEKDTSLNEVKRKLILHFEIKTQINVFEKQLLQLEDRKKNVLKAIKNIEFELDTDIPAISYENRSGNKTLNTESYIERNIMYQITEKISVLENIDAKIFETKKNKTKLEFETMDLDLYINMLSNTHKEIIVQRYMYEKSLVEMSIHFSMGKSTLRKHLKKALKEIKKILDNYAIMN